MFHSNSFFKNISSTWFSWLAELAQIAPVPIIIDIEEIDASVHPAAWTLFCQARNNNLTILAY